MNAIAITGNLTRDIELKSSQSGLSVCSFTLAVRRPYTAETTDFIPCVAWRQSADFLAKYAHKGSRVGVTGVLTSRTYEDREGKKRTVYEVTANAVELLESRSESWKENYTTTTQKPKQEQNTGVFEQELGDMLLEDDEMPF